jgi:hypothetical protein
MQFLYYLVQFLIDQAARMQPDGFDPKWPRRRNLTPSIIPRRCEASVRNPDTWNHIAGFRLRPCGQSRNAVFSWFFAPGSRDFRLTFQPFLPKKRLLAGRFRPALRFATRGLPSL